MNLPADFPFFDAIVISVITLSALIGLLRGFIHEILSLFGWIGALITAWLFAPHAAELLHDALPNAWLRKLVAGVGVFIIAIIIFGIISNLLSRTIGILPIHSINRLFGIIFGITRGYIIVCIMFAFLLWFWEDRPPPDFLANGKTQSVVAFGARELIALLNNYEDTPLFLRLKAITETGSTALELHQRLIAPQAEENTANENEKGYDTEEREALNNFFQQQK